MDYLPKDPQDIPPEDKVALSPLDKYRIYGKFPLNIIIHILLVVFTSIQALVILGVFTDYFRAQEKSLTNILISTDSTLGFNLAPWQTGQGLATINGSISSLQ